MTTLREHHSLVKREIEGALRRWDEKPNEFAGDPRDLLIRAMDHLTNLPELEDWPVRATEPNPRNEPLRRLLDEIEQVEANDEIWKLRINPNISQIQIQLSMFLMHAKEECQRALADDMVIA